MPGSFYEITQFDENEVATRTVLMISMEQKDWCEFKKEPLYRELIEYLDRLESNDAPKSTGREENHGNQKISSF